MPWHLSVSLFILMAVKAVDPRDWRRQRGAGQPPGLCGGSQHVLWVDPPKPGQREGKLVPGFPLLLTDLGSSSQGHQAHPPATSKDVDRSSPGASSAAVRREPLLSQASPSVCFFFGFMSLLFTVAVSCFSLSPFLFCWPFSVPRAQSGPWSP